MIDPPPITHKYQVFLDTHTQASFFLQRGGALCRTCTKHTHPGRSRFCLNRMYPTKKIFLKMQVKVWGFTKLENNPLG